MKLPPPLFSTKPDFINPEGSRWWIDKVLTDHAVRDLGKDHRVYAVQSVTDQRTILLLDDKNDVIAEAGGTEAMAYKIDAIRLIRR